jgi:hypothetical protein
MCINYLYLARSFSLEGRKEKRILSLISLLSLSLPMDDDDDLCNKSAVFLRSGTGCRIEFFFWKIV